MKNIMKIVVMCSCLLISVSQVYSQAEINEERMVRDIEVAENVLSTLLRQQLGTKSFFPIEFSGNYLPGFGVTFHVPSENFGTFILQPMIADQMDLVNEGISNVNGNIQFYKSQTPRANVKSLSRDGKKKNADSARTSYNDHIIKVSQDFIADYGDLISQLKPNEKIVITNRGEGQQRFWIGGAELNQTYLTIEGSRADVYSLRMGKITREQLISKIKVLNSELDNELQPDLELLSSIFSRLYRRDLSRSFFTEGNIYYERLKDYGVIYYMEVYSSNTMENDLFSMPTLRLQDLDQGARNKKVKELYPVFEKGIREDIIEYGRTLKSLKDDEVLSFNIRLTKCPGCEIPSTIEYSIKYQLLKDYASGKLTKDDAIAKLTVKKGPNQ